MRGSDSLLATLDLNLFLLFGVKSYYGVQPQKLFLKKFSKLSRECVGKVSEDFVVIFLQCFSAL